MGILMGRTKAFYVNQNVTEGLPHFLVEWQYIYLVSGEW